MHGERGVAGEGLATAALVGPLARVVAKVVGEVCALVACLAALGACVRPLPGVRSRLRAE